MIKDLEGSSRNLIEAQNLPTRTEVNQEIPQSG
jgi:hypothetical protein